MPFTNGWIMISFLSAKPVMNVDWPISGPFTNVMRSPTCGEMFIHCCLARLSSSVCWLGSTTEKLDAFSMSRSTRMRSTDEPVAVMLTCAIGGPPLVGTRPAHFSRTYASDEHSPPVYHALGA